MINPHDREKFGTFEPKDHHGDLYRAILEGLKEFGMVQNIQITRTPESLRVTFNSGVRFSAFEFSLNESARMNPEERIGWILDRMARLERQVRDKPPGPGAAWGKGPFE